MENESNPIGVHLILATLGTQTGKMSGYIYQYVGSHIDWDLGSGLDGLIIILQTHLVVGLSQ